MVVEIINISEKPQPSRGTQHRDKRQVSLRHGEQVCYVERRKSKIKCSIVIGTGDQWVRVGDDVWAGNMKL